MQKHSTSTAGALRNGKQDSVPQGHRHQLDGGHPVLALGEPGYESDAGWRKIGDGATGWAALGYQPVTLRRSTIPATQILKNPYNQPASSYNAAASALALIRGKMARTYAGIDRANVCVIGTCLSAGTGSQPGTAKSWPSQFGAMLKDRGYGLASGFIAAQSNLLGGTIDSW